MNTEKPYKEIKALTSFIEEHTISAKKADIDAIHADLVPVTLQIANKNILVQVMDEYNDLSHQNGLLTVVLCLRELELLEDSFNVAQWYKQQGLTSSSEKLENYYKSIIKELPELKVHFPNGALTSFIPDLDFQLNAGAAQALRKK